MAEAFEASMNTVFFATRVFTPGPGFSPVLGFTSRRGLLDEVTWTAILWPFSKVIAVSQRSISSSTGSPGVIISIWSGIRPLR